MSYTFTSDKKTKLDGIETDADVTGSNAPQAHGASVHTDRTRSIIISGGEALYKTAAYSNPALGLAFDGSASELADFECKLPRDFSSIGNIYIWMIGGGAGDAVLDFRTWYAGDGEGYTSTQNMDLGNVASFTSNVITKVSTSGLLSSADANDIILFRVVRDPGHASDTLGANIYLQLIEIEYTADM